MKIIIRQTDGPPIQIVLPTGLVLNRATALLMPAALRKRGVELTKDQALRMVQCIRTCRCRYPGWKLVEIESAGGEYVEIIL